MCRKTPTDQQHLQLKHNSHLFDNRSSPITLKSDCRSRSVIDSNFIFSGKELQKLVFESGAVLEPSAHENDLLPDSDDQKSTENKRIDEDNFKRAVDNLRSILGGIEFKLGLENIQTNQHKVAVKHFKSATTHRHAGATFNLGLCYELGIGVGKDMVSAAKCYQLASELKHKKALFNLGVFHARGAGGLAKNRDAAAACFEAAEKLGSRSKRTDVGMPYVRRKPDVNDIKFEANKWNTMNENGNHPSATYFCGSLHKRQN